MEQGLVAKHLQDPPTEFFRSLSGKGFHVHPSATCSVRGGTPSMLRVGWPSSTSEGYEVPVDILCGPLGCDRGYRVLVKKTESGLRGVGATVTWVS
jgi:hypothetical protein